MYGLYMCQIETELPVEYWRTMREVEIIINQDEFEKFAVSIRGKAGVTYVDACWEFADTLDVGWHEFTGYIPPRNQSHMTSNVCRVGRTI